MIHRDLKKLEEHGKQILIGMSGAGWMGSGFIAQVRYVPGMRVALLADRDTEKAYSVLKSSGIPENEIVETDSPGTAEDAVRKGKCVVTGDYTLSAQIDSVDIVTDVTPSPQTGAETAYAAINSEKDVVLINIEADVTVGRILKKLAAGKKGVLYTVSSGDEPGCLMELWDFVNSLGYEPVVIGKGKNNPLQYDASPDTVRESATRDGKDPYQVASYVDGTKTMFEMCCAANATGCMPMKRGMIGPEADLETVSQIFSLKADGGLAVAPYSVDFVQGKSMAGGVFVTVRIQDDRIADDLKYLKVGKGKYCTFFRPFHLWFLEAPVSFARAYLYRQETLVPLDEPVTDVMAVAKKSLKQGELLDTFGGYSFYGVIDRVGEVQKLNALPVGLAPGARMKKDVWKGKVITWDDVELDESSTLVRLRKMQDTL
jgi:predicted homoserine dehydrogenase-like protein